MPVELAPVGMPAPRNAHLAHYRRGASEAAQRGVVEIRRRGQHVGFLVPALWPLPERELETLSEWRNLHRSAFFSERIASTLSTARWLESIAASDDRLLFLITTADGRVVGHIGLNHVDESSRSGETDAWLGVGDTKAPGIMLFGFATLIHWGFSQLGLETLDAQVFSDNTRVIRAHEMLGFMPQGQAPFERHEDATGVWWQPGNAGAPRLVTRLRLDRLAFDARSKDWR